VRTIAFYTPSKYQNVIGQLINNLIRHVSSNKAHNKTTPFQVKKFEPIIQNCHNLQTVFRIFDKATFKNECRKY